MIEKILSQFDMLNYDNSFLPLRNEINSIYLGKLWYELFYGKICTNPFLLQAIVLCM